MVPQPEQELMGFFSSLGIMTTSEEGRLYPRSFAPNRCATHFSTLATA